LHEQFKGYHLRPLFRECLNESLAEPLVLGVIRLAFLSVKPID
jgi:hypothetical protein